MGCCFFDFLNTWSGAFLLVSGRAVQPLVDDRSPDLLGGPVCGVDPTGELGDVDAIDVPVGDGRRQMIAF